MVEDIPQALRQLVFDRAEGHCEYCLIHQDTVVALSCLRCNRYKGPNVGSFDPETGDLNPFYNPRTQDWQDHFQLDGPVIRPLTPQGRVTVKILRLNDATRLEEREALVAIGLYP